MDAMSHIPTGQTDNVEDAADNAVETKSFIKIKLTQTDVLLLYESPSETVPHDSEEAKHVIEENKRYDYLTKGKGRNRRITSAEAQTSDVLYKSRAVNTERIQMEEIGTFVSNYDMFDTYENVATKTTSLGATRDEKQIIITTYLKEGEVDPCDFLKTNENFRLSSMVLERICAGNVFSSAQKRFRNMTLPNPLATQVRYYYRLETLWSYSVPLLNNKAVVSASWCEDNSDLLAIGYGTYYFQSKSKDSKGYVCIWSIKNPVNPERVYEYESVVTAVAFSKETPQLLAVGLADGRLEVRDIRHDQDEFVAQSNRHHNSPGFEPIWQIEWIEGSGLFKRFGQILTASQDGRIMKYSFTAGPYLQGSILMRLRAVEGVVEGIMIAKSKDLIDANRHPQALCLRMHPQNKEIYFVGTNEGCRHRCSINYSKQHSGILQVHNGSVYNIEYSPWSPKIFLTCGSDWYIRIWIEGIYKPIVELSRGIGCVNNALWSPINSTIIASCTSEAVEIWDIRRRILKPVSTHKFPEANSSITVIKFSKCGRSLMVGTACGTTYICALEDMPFPPYYQFDALENALYTALNADQILLDQVKSTKNLRY